MYYSQSDEFSPVLIFVPIVMVFARKSRRRIDLPPACFCEFGGCGTASLGSQTVVAQHRCRATGVRSLGADL